MSLAALVADLYFHPHPREYSSDFLNVPKKRCASHSLMFLSNRNSSNLNLDFCDVLDFIFGKQEQVSGWGIEALLRDPANCKALIES